MIFRQRWIVSGMVAVTTGLTGGWSKPAGLLVENALLFTMADGERDPFVGHLVIGGDGRILAVGPGQSKGWEGDETVDLGGQWVMPGFVSAHSHLWQSAWRGLGSDQTLMDWVDALYMARARFAQAEDYYWFTLHGGLDHLRHGITAAYNFNYGGWADRDYAEFQLRGEMESGIRFVHGQNFGRWGEVPAVESAVREGGEFLVWIARQETGDRLLGTMINGTALFRDSPAAAEAEAALMTAHGIGNHVHALESPPDKFEERSRFRWLVDTGLMGKGPLLGHFIHTDPWILAEAVAGGATMSWNPLSNGRLASGTPDIPAYLAAGLTIGMGVDGQASADRADPFENVRMGLYAVRGKYEDAKVLSPYDVLRLHTQGSAAALRVQDRIGSLEAGKMGDFIVIDPTDFGIVFDPYATLAFMGAQEHLAAVYVGGKRLIDAGSIAHLDFAEVRREVNARVVRVKSMSK